MPPVFRLILPIALLTVLVRADADDLLSYQEQAIIDWTDAHSDQAIELLEETVNIGSGTMNHRGVRA
ncbi:MAG: hypothetical protein L7T24_04360, partial [Luminiphilus sp.]|nr:hypothetical protein [Luminiphilus sp.]